MQTVAAINTLGRTFLIGKDAPASFTLSMSKYFLNVLDYAR